MLCFDDCLIYKTPLFLFKANRGHSSHPLLLMRTLLPVVILWVIMFFSSGYYKTAFENILNPTHY